ncbi:helix-turn-helix domain-containing protein [Arthrobacter monumenti]
MSLKFRNLNVSPQDPVENWGFEGLLAAVDRGAVPEWRRITHAVRINPRGKVAGELREVIAVAEDISIAAVLARILDEAVKDEDELDKKAAAGAMRAAFQESGMTRAQFAERLGTSASRLSTYLNGKVTPSAALLLRAQRIAPAAQREMSV